MIHPRLILFLLPILLFKLTASITLPKPAWALSPSGTSLSSECPSGITARSGPPAVPYADILDHIQLIHFIDFNRAAEEANAGIREFRRLSDVERQRIVQALIDQRRAWRGMELVQAEENRLEEQAEAQAQALAQAHAHAHAHE
ncbi:unnamed protein product [Tilletia controversa]|uniref:Uncharacterized protein n=1 Tax=Tilletia controversa TaxID=13291 RepID=A0A8X7MPL7_9BASI|nr:hypothetical protein CF328_g6038 [Tilletia controversa]KAE8242864.1 hypothetical protein A4X06_0g6718 [Tilletia controversa]CAD6907378.1 unnamed protein product [Tilletia controversa]CAD6977853.1 unnamed protein product [Tilletia controversa]